MENQPTDGSPRYELTDNPRRYTRIGGSYVATCIDGQEIIDYHTQDAYNADRAIDPDAPSITDLTTRDGRAMTVGYSGVDGTWMIGVAPA